MASTPDFSIFEDFAVRLARAAAEEILPRFRTDCGDDNKAAPGQRWDPVTEADRGAERAIRKLISAEFPEHGVLGEEYGADRDDAEFVWVLDPVDGTRAFVAGLPLWTTLIALRWRGKPVVGLIAQPYLDEIFLGGPNGSRALIRGTTQALKVRACPLLTQAAIATTDPELFNEPELGAWTQVRAAARLTRFGCDAYAYAMVAMGRLDLVIEAGLKPWDYQPLMPVIRGAGGIVTNWLGQEPDGNGQIVAAGDHAALEEALVALRRSAI
jgi:histidinol phosphatase-like enzyme (inositol monophosphatase family)